MVNQGDSLNRAQNLLILYLNFLVKKANAPQSFCYVDYPYNNQQLRIESPISS